MFSDRSSSLPDSRKEVKTIKRYSNRKLYDTVESRYITLEEITEMVKSGIEVRIIDNHTKQELTSVILAQIVFEQEKRRTRLPLSILRAMVRHGGGILTDLLPGQWGQRIHSLKDEAEGFWMHGHKTIDELQKRVDERVRQAVDNLTHSRSLSKEIASLKERISQLENELDKLE
jgi:polyhydroxyalkanoate synthesis repressor PhaR